MTKVAHDLSSPDVVRAIPTDQDGLFPDAAQDGLYVRVQRGAVSWVIRYNVGGVKRQKTLPITQPYKKARDLALELRLEARRGRDVLAERREELVAKRAQERAEREREQRSLGKLIEAYLADAESKLRPSTMKETRRYLRVALKPLHDQDAESMSVRTIAAALADVAKERGRTSANRCRSYLSACLSYGVGVGMLERNVVVGTRRPQPEQRRDRVLGELELRRVWEAADPATDYGAIVRLLILLGQRREEVGGMRWSEIDLDKGTWIIPGERAKNKRPHLVPLPRQALAILKARAPAEDAAQDDDKPERRDTLFGRRQAGFGGWSKAKGELDTAIAAAQAKAAGREKSEPEDALTPWVLHDLRRSTVTHMAELGVEPHHIEAVVNHISGHKGGIAGVYNRATYATEKRIALQKWADHIERLVTGEQTGKVVAFPR